MLICVQIQPGNIEVEEVASKVDNGELWVLRGVRSLTDSA